MPFFVIYILINVLICILIISLLRNTYNKSTALLHLKEIHIINTYYKDTVLSYLIEKIPLQDTSCRGINHTIWILI